MRCAGMLLAALSISAALCLGAVKLVEDQPTTAPARAGDVTGLVSPPGKIAQLRAISRVTGKLYPAASLDKKTGKFIIKNLPGDARYDVWVRTTDGRDFQGIDLDFTDAGMLRLAAIRRKQLKLPPERGHKFCQEDVQWICNFVDKQKSFMDIKRALYVQGRGRRATALVELTRTRGFYSSGGTMVWRVELWYFDYKYDGWQRLANQERIVERRRLTPAQWRKIHIEYYPALSAYVTPEGKCKPVEFRIPDEPDITRGRPANTEPKQNTRPHVLGLDVKPERAAKPATAPAAEKARR